MVRRMGGGHDEQRAEAPPEPIALAAGSLRRALFAMATLGLVASAIVHEYERSWAFTVHLVTDGGVVLALALLARRAPVTVVALVFALFAAQWTAALASRPAALADPGLVGLIIFFAIAAASGLRSARAVRRLTAATAAVVPPARVV
jgi:hypothetical protein